MPSFEIASETAEGQKIQAAILADAERLDYDEPDLFALRLAVEEALVNAIKHGNNSDPRKKVKGSYEVTENEVRITIGDEGPGIHRSSVPDPTDPENLEKPSGRGLLLMEHYMSEVHYLRNGVELVLRRGNDLGNEEKRTGNETVVDVASGDTHVNMPNPSVGGSKRDLHPSSRSPGQVTTPPKNRRDPAVFASPLGPAPEMPEFLRS